MKGHLSRRSLLAAGAALPMFAQTDAPPGDKIAASLAGTLSRGDPGGFLSHFDRSMPGYTRFRALIEALVNQNEVGSSIDVLKDEGSGGRGTLELDWILEITGKQPDAPGERRHETVRCTLERKERQWLITAIEPLSFFEPPRPSP